ncbi:MAG: TolC family protein [Nitrospirae bacterium]|nr:TolC family protein [Nitrospirota bacterium]
MRGIETAQSSIARRLSLCLWCVSIFVFSSGEFSWSVERTSEGPAQQLAYPSTPNIPQTKGAFLGYEAAIRIGLDRHPLLRRSRETALAAEAVMNQAAARYYPELNAYAIHTGGTVRPLSAFNVGGAQNKPTSYVESAGFRADQLIYDFGQTTHKVLAERAGQEAAEKDIQTRKATVILRVQQAYIHCLRQKRLIDIAEETVRERGVLRDQIATLFKRELKSKLDFDFISVELTNAEVQLLQAKNELRAAFAGLNNAMGVRGSEDYTLEDLSTPSASLDSLEALITRAQSNRPELLGTTDRIKQADERVSSAQAMNLPTIAALGMAGVIHFSDAPLNQYAGSHPGQTNLWWGAGAMVSVPIFTGFLIDNRVAEARQEKYKVEQKKVNLSNNIALEVTDAYLALHAARQQIVVEEKEVESARSALTLSKERYRLGLASVVDVTTATTALLTAEVRLSEARYGVLAGTAALAFATGRGLLEY